MDPRSWLLVPGDNERKIGEGLRSEADALIFDLEDSVAPARKATAREALSKALAKHTGRAQWWVRVNAIDSEHFGADLACCEGLEIEGLVLPKAEDGAQITQLTGDIAEAGWKIHAIARSDRTSSTTNMCSPTAESCSAEWSTTLCCNPTCWKAIARMTWTASPPAILALPPSPTTM